MYGRCRLDHRAQLRGVWPAGQWRYHFDVRRRLRIIRTFPASGAIIERHGVTVFYTAPTAIRAFMKAGRELVDKHDLSSLRLLGTVGEPINPEAWMWYHEVIGGKRCPIADTWWQTETGMHMITPLPGGNTDKTRHRNAAIFWC